MNFTDVDDKTIAGARRRACRCASTPISYIAAFREDARRSASSRSKRRRARPTSEPAGDGRHDPRARASAATPTRSDGSIYFKISTLPDVRQAGAARSRRHPGRRARRLRRVRQGRRARLRAVEGDQAGRADVGRRLRPGPARAGTSSARRWRCGCSASRRSTSTPAASIWSSRITRTRSRRAKAPPARQFSRFWLHVEHLLVDNQKMSKSLGNVYTVQDVLDEGFRAVGAALPAAVGALPQAAELHVDRPGAGGRSAAPHHRFPRPRRQRSPAATRIRRVDGARQRRRVDAFDAALRDDLNTAAGLGAIFDLVRALNIAMDAKQVGAGRRRRRSARRSTTSIACSACCRCAAREDATPPIPRARSSA